ncbi:MAG: protein kinase [Acidobacteriota bacterium]
MADTYGTFGSFLLLKQRSQDGLGTLWRAGEMEKGGFKRIVWMRRFDQVSLDFAALESELPLVGQLAQAFKATNVVRNASAGSESGMPYLAWDYVPSQPLDQLMARVVEEHFPISIDNSLLIAEKLAASLSAAAAVELRGEPLVHGFLVPHLVLVGNDGEAMVAGFGLARGLAANLDRVAVQKMAAPYLAPEVLASASLSRRADVYSIGAILYHLVCGTPLPAAPAQRAAALENPQLAFEEGPVPQDVLMILRRALAARPEERYASAAEFKRDLEKLLYGGTYSPTTFNLALFMDRLYRHEIEEEDRELQRERALDVTAYYRPPRSAGSPADLAAAAEAPPPSRTGLYFLAGAVAVLLAVIAYLLFGRAAAPPALDQQAQQKMLNELVQSEIAKQLEEREKKLRDELEAQRVQNETLREKIAQQQAGSRPGAQRSPEEQRRLEQAQRDLAAREEAQRQKEAELAKVREQRAQVAASVPTAAPVIPTAAPPVVAAQPPAAEPPASQLVEPTAAPVAAAPAVEPTSALTPVGLGAGVREGDYVDFAQVDVPPQELVTQRPVLPRSAFMARAGKGVVILSALVNEKGGVERVDVLRGFPVSRLGVDEACIEAVKQYRYRPGTKGGLRIKTKVTVTLQVDLTHAR